MKKYKEKTFTQLEEVGSTCDICGVSTSNYDIWPDGGITRVWLIEDDDKEIHFDICPDCFKTKLTQWFDSFKKG